MCFGMYGCEALMSRLLPLVSVRGESSANMAMPMFNICMPATNLCDFRWPSSAQGRYHGQDSSSKVASTTKDSEVIGRST